MPSQNTPQSYNRPKSRFNLQGTVPIIKRLVEPWDSIFYNEFFTVLRLPQKGHIKAAF